jgi:polysaccharide pyruvyl transferase CsaB
MNYSQIVICGNYGAQNLGDEMILSGLIKYLKHKYINCNITVLSANPEETAKQYNVKSARHLPAGVKSYLNYFFKRSTYSKTIKAVQNADVFVLGGGGLFSNLSLKANFIWANQIRLALKHNKNLKIWNLGQSLPPLKSKFAQYLARKTYEKSDLIVFRDSKSVENLKKLSKNLKSSHKPDFALNASGIKNIQEENFIYFKKFLAQPTKKVNHLLISLRAMNNSKVLKKLRQKVKELDPKKITCLNFQPRFDNKLHEKLGKQLGHKNFKIVSPQNEEQAAKYFKDADLIITMRLHATIAALNQNKKPVVIAYAPKVKQLLSSFKR